MHFHTSLVLLSASLLYHVTYASMAPVSIVMTMIIRDEEVNLRSNLHLWNGIIDKYVFLIDDRTVDQSEAAIRSILHDKSSYVITPFHFEGFGQARTESLSLAWERFPTASHVWIADPDWRPDVNTISKSDLEQSAETYEFIIFDRNGYTERTSDWLLRHRAGLRMKYHLHEVLDIDRSRNTSDVYGLWLGWSVHEVEQSGSWHSTVGHGHSMSAERFLFDISLLEKDLSTYGHDAHTHFYLGISHMGVAEKSRMNDPAATAYHSDLAIKFFTIFVEEHDIHSGVVKDSYVLAYLMLGNLFHYFKNDREISEKWFLLCLDIDPSNDKCALELGRLYISFGMMQPLYNTVLRALRRPLLAGRSIVTYSLVRQCDLPSLAVEVLLHASRLLPDKFNLLDIKYVYLLIDMVKCDICAGGNIYVPADSELAIKQLARSNNVHLPLYRVKETLCADSALRQYLMKKEYTLHSCDDLQQELIQQQLCRSFATAHAPPYEGYQIPVFGEYIGAAIIPDIVHHVYGGDARPVLADKQRTIFRVLFAEHFSDHNVFNLASVISNDDFNVDITVLASPGAIRRIRAVFATCNLRLALRITFVPLQENKTYSESLGDRVVGRGYDYIEYNGGASRSEKYVDELLDLRKLLSSRGSMGVTFFSANDHLDVIRRTLRNVNASSHPPFSVEPDRLTKHLLESLGLSAYVNDADLTSFLSNITQRAFSREDISELMSTLDLKILSWLPTAYSHPFDELPHHSVQVYRSHGMSEKDVVESVIGGFRYTVYVSRSDAMLSGRKRVSSRLISDDTSYTVVDRVGYLGTVFKSGVSNAKAELSMHWSTTPLSNKALAFDLMAHMQVVACLSQLSDGVNIGDLIALNVATLGNLYMKHTSEKILLISLQYFEALNMITLWKSPIDRQHQGNNTGFEGDLVQKTSARLPSHANSKVSGPSDDSECETKMDRVIYFKSLKFSSSMISLFLENEGFYDKLPANISI